MLELKEMITRMGEDCTLEPVEDVLSGHKKKGEQPKLQVEPPEVSVSQDQPVSLKVDIVLAELGPFAATLVIETGHAGMKRYEIPLIANAGRCLVVLFSKTNFCSAGSSN
jgi:hypothetical protein